MRFGDRAQLFVGLRQRHVQHRLAGGAPSSRNCIASVVLPEPGTPSTRYRRSRVNPPHEDVVEPIDAEVRDVPRARAGHDHTPPSRRRQRAEAEDGPRRRADRAADDRPERRKNPKIRNGRAIFALSRARDETWPGSPRSPGAYAQPRCRTVPPGRTLRIHRYGLILKAPLLISDCTWRAKSRLAADCRSGRAERVGYRAPSPKGGGRFTAPSSAATARA